MRRPATGAPTVALRQLAALGVAFGVVEIVLFPPGRWQDVAHAVAYTVTAWVYLGAGIAAWSRRPGSRIGPLLTAGGGMWLLCGLASTTVPVLVGLGIVVATIPVAVLLHVLLAFPSGHLGDRWSRLLVVGGYVTTTVLQAPVWLWDPASPFLFADRPDLLFAGRLVNSTCAFVVILGTAAVVVARLRAARTADRPVLAPLYLYGGGAIVVVVVAGNLYRVAPVDPVVVDWVQVALLAGVPIAFAAGVLLGGFARTAAIEELGVWLGSTERRRGEVGPALARTLGDPSLTLAFRGDDGSWVDGDGHPAVVPPGLALVPIELAGRPVGAIVHDPSLQPNPDTVRAAGRVVAIAVDRERLTARLLAEQEQLRESRTRLVEAGDRERRRLARDLHDRLQSRLVLLALRAGTARPETADLEAFRRDVDQVAAEVRSIVAGVMPALLIERGLSSAVEDMLARTPLQTRLDTDDLDGPGLPPSVEGTAYHVVAESITNTVKHAVASSLVVGLHHRTGVLTVSVHDDGCGGAVASGGTGLRGLRDRVEALGGRFAVDSPDEGGTTVVAEIPCAS
ncbi:ATP-binding protein [Actinomycetospora sp. TBRC 11914]|uniref:sensor histidine kinase n=1 Tax=Actinomycetospora sp. TBRC 11914 TaxID=2729387 RepID=UPI00145DB06C|nr:ATP-binding protein [Actinomycetospora sp. TBRC 11914]NMO93567.1 sensor histidine kinase [Actinomycetospora sp. TBRC 11914]